MAYQSFDNWAGRNNFNRNNVTFKRSNNMPTSPLKKHSGAKQGQTKKGETYVRGWNYSRRHGMRTVICGPNKKTEDHKSKTSGRIYRNWTAKVTFSDGRSELFGCLYEPSTGKVIIRDMGWVLNPRAKNGGYCGKFSS